MNKNWSELSAEEKKWLFDWNNRNVNKGDDGYKKSIRSN